MFLAIPAYISRSEMATMLPTKVAISLREMKADS